jgi:hypothetical protein
MGVREALWLTGLALVCYAVWQFFRALRAPRSSTTAVPAATGGGDTEAPRAGAGHAALPGGAARPSGQGRLGAGAQTAEQNEEAREDENEDGFDAYAPLPAPQVGPTRERAQEPPESSPVQSDVAQPDVFQLQLDNSRLRQALQAQRDLVSLQQGEIDRLVRDITALHDELERLREQPTSSPEYSEAMVLAAQGLNAEMIAARCGITVAEAELVLSLARRGEGLL